MDTTTRKLRYGTCILDWGSETLEGEVSYFKGIIKSSFPWPLGVVWMTELVPFFSLLKGFRIVGANLTQWCKSKVLDHIKDLVHKTKYAYKSRVWCCLSWPTSYTWMIDFISLVEHFFHRQISLQQTSNESMLSAHMVSNMLKSSHKALYFAPFSY